MPSSESEGWAYLTNRFGVEREDLENYDLVENSGDIWLITESYEEFDDLDFETLGIRFLRITGRGLKPTTYGLQIIGDELEKNVIDVDRDELSKLLAREEMIPRDLEEEGYVAIRYEEQIIGCGYYMDDVVSSRIPKGRSKELLQII